MTTSPSFNTQDGDEPTVDEAVFNSYQEPSPVTARHIDNIIGVTKTMAPPRPVEQSASDAEYAAFKDWQNRNTNTPEKGSPEADSTDPDSDDDSSLKVDPTPAKKATPKNVLTK